MSLEALKHASDALRALVRKPTMHLYPRAGRCDYVSTEQLREVADQLDRAIAATPWMEGADLLALAAERDDWQAAAETWHSAYDLASKRCLAVEAELSRIYEAAGQAYLEHVAIVGELDAAEAEAEGLAQALRDQGAVVDSLIDVAATWKIEALQIGSDLKRTAAENARLEDVTDRTEDVCERLSDRLVDLNTALSRLCSDLGGLCFDLDIDSATLTVDELVPALRDAIAHLKRPRPSLLSRLFC